MGNYVIIYRIENEDVLILRVLLGAAMSKAFFVRCIRASFGGEAESRTRRLYFVTPASQRAGGYGILRCNSGVTLAVLVGLGT